ncbi:excalibur calcium-binding domain-containing protein [Bacillus arachidis]|uniref:Excalibur calcium-binding domain-containing protein n=1 Tax=Bacillus arachidis TaxID=2819290 RepID=A0ABS3P4W2_9BACI|nr:excalibur calcium-binding domain-containing protein [Bacillus arachidis]MBO1628228.1 excalibur calcium-binding domain-containing protein [Bacillus arachidis]
MEKKKKEKQPSELELAKQAIATKYQKEYGITPIIVTVALGGIKTGYAAVSKEHIQIFTYDRDAKDVVSISTHHFSDYTDVFIDHYAIKSNFEFKGIKDTFTFTPNGSGKEIESLIKSYTEIEIHKTERKWYQKILGFRSGNKVKMVIASLIYLTIVVSIFNTITGKKEETKQEVKPATTTNTAPVKEEKKVEPKPVEQPVDKKQEKINKFKDDTQKRLTETYKKIDGVNPTVSISDDGKLITFAFDLDAYAKHDKVDKELSVSTFKTSAGPYVSYKSQAFRAYGKEANISNKDDIVVKIVDSSNNQVVIDNVGSYKEEQKQATAPVSKPEEKPKQPEENDTPSNENSVVYENCTQVRKAGKAPIKQGEPGYSKKLDKDGDGIACDK